MSTGPVTTNQGADDALGTVEGALASLRSGRPVLVVDEQEQARPGHVVVPAALAEVPWVAWAIRYTSGLLCAALPQDRADRVDLPPMVRSGNSGGAAYTVAIDAARGVTTGISAADRTRTARVLADPDSERDDLTRPGHMLGLRTGAEGVLGHRGFAETAVDLCTLAGLSPVGLITAVTELPEGRDGTAALAQRYALPVVTVGELIQYRLVHGDGRKGRVARGKRRSATTLHGQFDVLDYHDHVTGAGHFALVSPTPTVESPSAMVHVECLTGDVLGDAACDCRSRFDEALANTAVHGGAVISPRHESGPANTATKPDCDGVVAASAVETGAAAAIVADLGLTEIHFDRESTAMAELIPSAPHVAG